MTTWTPDRPAPVERGPLAKRDYAALWLRIIRGQLAQAGHARPPDPEPEDVPWSA